MALNVLQNNYKTGGNSQTTDEVKKNFYKHFQQACTMIGENNKMGYDAIKLLLHSHFQLFLQNEETLIDLMLIVYPGEKNKKKSEILDLILEIV